MRSSRSCDRGRKGTSVCIRFPELDDRWKEGCDRHPASRRIDRRVGGQLREDGAEEMIDYLKNGNIRHSVNYPDCDMGVCQDQCRIAINHRNIKNMIGQYSSVLGEAGANIADMTNKSRNDYAYSLLDLDAPISAEVVEKLAAIDGVLKVRVIK